MGGILEHEPAEPATAGHGHQPPSGISMQVIVKIPRHLLERALIDLHRPHAFASERVGFFWTRTSNTRSGVLVHCVNYSPVADDHYIRDDRVGVRIGPDAIRVAMGRALRESCGQLHVHSHGTSGLPHPSSVDTSELPGVANSLRNANGKQAHGWVILGHEDAWSELSLPDCPDVITCAHVSVIGFPTRINRRVRPLSLQKNSFWSKLCRKKAAGSRYNRQSFLGSDSEQIIGGVRFGVIGLGGGGSHIVQQLAHVGFRNFALFDDDRISDSNLNRLVGGTLYDVKKKRLKTEIAERTVTRLHKDAQVELYSTRWEEATPSLMECDVIIGCVDTFAARRDIEIFCRRHLIPYIDVGMDVHKSETGRFEIYGQTILSMPGSPCMHCMGFLTSEVLAQEARKYGDAGHNPQVIWSNGLLCSAAVGIAVDLLTDWSVTLRHPVYQCFQGSELSLAPDKRLPALKHHVCPHFPLVETGDAKFRQL